MPPTYVQDSVFTMSRTFNAPREMVFQAWTEANRLAQWWGPKGCLIGVESLDFRPGGRFHYSMKTPDGGKMYGMFQYLEIAPPNLLVWLNSFADAEGNLTRAPFAQEFPLETHSTLIFEAVEGGTRLTLRGVPHNATPEEHAFFKNMHASMQMGWGGTLDQLADYLAKA